LLRRAASDGSFFGISYMSSVVVGGKCGNRLLSISRFGRAANSLIVFRAFHKPSFPRSTSLLSGVQADFLSARTWLYWLRICRALRVAHGCGYAFECIHAESGAQELFAAIGARAVFRAVFATACRGAVFVPWRRSGLRPVPRAGGS